MTWLRGLIQYSVWESLRMALGAMWAHKLRAALTLLGVMIGVMTIISTMTVLGGIKHSITTSMQNSLAVNVFQVQRYDDNGGGIHMGPRQRQRRPEIEPEYADVIRERCPSVRAVGVEAWEFGYTLRRGSLESNPSQQIAGGSAEFAFNNGYNLALGRPITQQDIAADRDVIVLGWAAYKKLFDRLSPLGNFVRVAGHKFEVIGVFEERGSLLGESKDNDNWIPISAWFRVFGDRSVNLTVQAWSGGVFDQAQQEVIEAMRSVRGLKPGQKNNFAMWTPDMVQNQFNQMTAVVGIAAFGICAISLLVAGIGIMNIMLVSVTERTREIGLRKALGGTRSSILRQFLIEAFMLSQVGGLVGIMLGYIVAAVINNQLHFPAPIPIWAVSLAVIFCSVIGIGFGMWPAIKAARLDPIEALRYE
ncbi:ABC transporter permease [candidate division KSB1 bacterium]|nr:ABC transporter permease [candidate division KSB1 bacterium]